MHDVIWVVGNIPVFQYIRTSLGYILNNLSCCKIVQGTKSKLLINPLSQICYFNLKNALFSMFSLQSYNILLKAK